MVGFLLRAAISALGLWIASEILPGLRFDSTSQLFVAALLLGIVNAFVRPLAFILRMRTVPLGSALPVVVSSMRVPSSRGTSIAAPAASALSSTIAMNRCRRPRTRCRMNSQTAR